MPSGPYERFYPGEDRGLLDPTWGGGAYRLNAPSISQVEPWHVGAALGVSAVPGLLGAAELAVPSLLRGAQLVNRGLTTAGSKVDDIIKTATGPLKDPSRRTALKDITVMAGKGLLETSPLLSLPLKNIDLPPDSGSSFPAIKDLSGALTPFLKHVLKEAQEDKQKLSGPWNPDDITLERLNLDYMGRTEEEKNAVLDSYKISRSWGNAEVDWDESEGGVVDYPLPDSFTARNSELEALSNITQELKNRGLIPQAYQDYVGGKHAPMFSLPERERAEKGPLGGQEFKELFWRISSPSRLYNKEIDLEGRVAGNRTFQGPAAQIYSQLRGANDAAIAIEWLSKKDPQALLDALDTLLEQYDSRFDDKRYWYEDIETKQDFLIQLRKELTG